MKAKIYTIDGKQGKEITLPSCFTQKVRAELIHKIEEAKKTMQPYAPSPVAGNQYSASGKMIHRRKVWKSQYGRGMSRIPRKIMSVKGSQFNWVGATVPNTRGGRRAHPPKAISMINTLSINKKELRLALCSAISATASVEWLNKKYTTLDNKKLQVPFIVESKFTKLKVKELKNTIEKIIGKELSNIIFKNKTIRAGKGKTRGRKYKSNQGVLLVIGKEEKLKTKNFDIQTTAKLGIMDLAKGNPGRLTIYTEKAVEELGVKLK
ncbi:MAG: 50S ribosomal protein L4 [Nanoarchaeota archaeon]|nr:50S ribosomal protein L4 [Nanoarchaeota archaeon]